MGLIRARRVTLRNDNLLDLVFTNSPELLSNVNSGPSYFDVGLPSDHYPVFFDINLTPRSTKKEESFRFDFSKVDFELLNERLKLLPLSSGVNTAKSEELDSLWDNWNDFVLSTMSDCAPKCKRRFSRYPPWINGDLAKAIRKKKTLWKQTKRSDDMALKEKFRKERQRIKNWIRLERTLYFIDLGNNAVAKPKKFWSFFSFKTRDYLTQ